MSENNQNSQSGIGYLIVRVSTALGAIPVVGASVAVRNNIPTPNATPKDVIQVMKTDRDGKTPRLELPAPPRQNSQTQNGAQPYATYHIDVHASGYYDQYYNNVPVYDGVTSIQPALLIPISQDQLPENERYFEENVNPSLRPNDPTL